MSEVNQMLCHYVMLLCNLRVSHLLYSSSECESCYTNAFSCRLLQLHWYNSCLAREAAGDQPAIIQTYSYINIYILKYPAPVLCKHLSLRVKMGTFAPKRCHVKHESKQITSPRFPLRPSRYNLPTLRFYQKLYIQPYFPQL